jgi:hypothetical protein
MAFFKIAIRKLGELQENPKKKVPYKKRFFRKICSEVYLNTFIKFIKIFNF